jgi:S-adenosylmethionine synthetase
MEKLLFTSESVSEGHPDKVCDQISDAILDAYLEVDPQSRVACETFVTTERVVVGGEIRSNGTVDVESIVRNVLREIGYTHKDLGIGADTCQVDVLLHNQSADIAQGVDEGENKAIGAGDQG